MLNRLPISLQIALIPATFLMLCIIGLVIVEKQLVAHGDVSARIDIAGRQRMLNQRLFKEVLIHLGTEQSDPAKTQQMLLESAKALQDGGPLPMGNTTVTLTPPTGETRDILARQLPLLGELMAVYKDINRVQPGSVGQDELLKQANDLSQEFHQVADAGVKALVRESKQDLKTIMAQVAIIYALTIVLGGLLSWVIGRSLSQRLRRVVVVLDHVAQGDLTQKI